MTDDDPSPTKSPLAKPTAAQLAEDRAKRLAYEDQRRCYTQAWHRQLAGLPEEPEDAPGQVQEEPQPGTRRSRARGKIHDPRQGSFEV